MLRQSHTKPNNWAISLNPSGSTSYYAKGMVLQALNQYDEAIAAFEKGLEQCPNDDMLLQGLENVKMEKRYASDSCDRNEGDLFAFAQNPGHSYPQASAPPCQPSIQVSAPSMLLNDPPAKTKVSS